MDRFYIILYILFLAPSLLQVPFYRGERITFDVAPSRMDFKVEHNSLKLEVKMFDVLIDLGFIHATTLKSNAGSFVLGPAHIPRHGLFRDGPSSQQPGGGWGARGLSIHQQSD